ncbi:TPA: hypothetical protein QCX97_004286 [Bacillus wiedmannii]|nr:hypothetical protein [Bacillus wiedmannii]HDR7944105.1 hypothetical protein [Bacillus wiedmannii]HDR7962729.1 hypothetical protein [Bacillus wiedmannii]
MDTRKELEKLVNSIVLKKFNLPINLEGQQNPMLFELFNHNFISRMNEKKLLLPNFEKTETVCILSDYGGEASNSRYLTYSTTLVDYDFLGLNYVNAIKEIREKHGLNKPYKEIAFKDLRYGPIERALDEYLNMIDLSVNGLVFTLIVDKSVYSLFGENSPNTRKRIAEALENEGFGGWKPKTAEKLQRIITPIAYLTNLLIPYGKKLFWMTDEDSIIAKPEQHVACGKYFNSAIHQFKGANYPTVGYAKPFEKGTDVLLLDLLSISDLVAGAIEHFYTREATQEDLTISNGANKILMWHANQGIAFKKLAFKIKYEDNKLSGGFVDFTLCNPLENVDYIDIIM